MFYLTNQEHSYTVKGYLASPRGSEMVDRIQLIYYQNLDKLEELHCGTYIFSDYERLTRAQDKLVLEVWEQLSRAGSDVRLLNNPTKVLRRYELLRKAHELGINDFRVFRATADLDGMRFPVFIREEKDHTGSLSKLLRNRADLDQALRELSYEGTPYPPSKLLIVEFWDTSEGTPFYKKYSAFKVGDAIVPRYLHTSRDWVVKNKNAVITEKTAEEELVYLTTNPHDQWIRKVFALAGIDYGRIDYGRKGDRLQVWEINTNPMMGPDLIENSKPRSRVDLESRALLEPGKQIAHDAFRRALMAIDRRPGPKTISIDVNIALAGN